MLPLYRDTLETIYQNEIHIILDDRSSSMPSYHRQAFDYHLYRLSIASNNSFIRHTQGRANKFLILISQQHVITIR